MNILAGILILVCTVLIVISVALYLFAYRCYELKNIYLEHIGKKNKLIKEKDILNNQIKNLAAEQDLRLLNCDYLITSLTEKLAEKEKFIDSLIGDISQGAKKL